jgi:PEP-CTERM motif
MKRSIFIAVLGMGAAATAFGQGKVDFSNYTGSNAPKVKYSSNAAVVPAGKAGQTIGSSFSAALLYYVGTSALDIPTQSSQLTPFGGAFPLFGTSLGGTGADNTAYTGWFEGGIITIPGVTGSNSGFVSFEVEAFNSASYAAATIRGISSIFQSPTTSSSQGSAGGFTPGSWQSFTVQNVAAVPEPTTLALAGLGGLASLVMLRRKNA